MAPFAWGIIGLVILFALQLLLCFRIRRTAVKCIPAYLILLGFLFSGAAYMGVFGAYSAGAISGNELAALILAFIVGIAAAGVLAAWLVYWLVSFLRKRRNP